MNKLNFQTIQVPRQIQEEVSAGNIPSAVEYCFVHNGIQTIVFDDEYFTALKAGVTATEVHETLHPLVCTLRSSISQSRKGRLCLIGDQYLFPKTEDDKAARDEYLRTTQISECQLEDAAWYRQEMKNLKRQRA